MMSASLPDVQAQDGRAALRRAHGPMFIIRGDLRSTTGYGHETRALARLLRPRFEILGVDLHHNPLDDSARFPGRLIQDADIAALCEAGARPFVLNNTPPETFAYFQGATNIGAFYWESDPLPRLRRWPEMICAMDHVWAKTRFDQALIRESGFSRPVPIVTWPFDFDAVETARPETLAGLDVFWIDHMAVGGPAVRRMAEVRRGARNLFLSVKSLAPRKGLPILLSEWRDYIQSTDDHNDALCLKLKFTHNDKLEADIEQQIAAMLARAGFRDGERVRIAFTAADLTHQQLRALYALSDAYVTTSYGEGFGGPVVESLLTHRPVIAARHTAAEDLLAADHPFLIESRRLHVGLRGNSQIYPNAASWHVPVQGSVVRALQGFADTDAEARIAATRAARAHAAAFCGRAAVQRHLDAFFAEVAPT